MPALEQNSVKDVLSLSDIAFEGRPTDRGGNSPRGVRIDIDDDDLGGASAMKGFAQRLADAIAAAGDDDDLIRHLHSDPPC